MSRFPITPSWTPSFSSHYDEYHSLEEDRLAEHLHPAKADPGDEDAISSGDSSEDDPNNMDDETPILPLVRKKERKLEKKQMEAEVQAAEAFAYASFG
jgi:hypothetical protein